MYDEPEWVTHARTRMLMEERARAEHEPTRADLVALIDWLALPYASDPDFIVADEPNLPFTDTGYRERLRATWQAVVGTKGPSGRPVAAARCRTCGMIQFVPIEEETSHGPS